MRVGLRAEAALSEVDRLADPRVDRPADRPADHPAATDPLVALRVDMEATMEVTITAITATPSNGSRWPFRVSLVLTTRSTARYLRPASSVATKSCQDTTAIRKQNVKFSTFVKLVSAAFSLPFSRKSFKQVPGK